MLGAGFFSDCCSKRGRISRNSHINRKISLTRLMISPSRSLESAIRNITKTIDEEPDTNPFRLADISTVQPYDFVPLKWSIVESAKEETRIMRMVLDAVLSFRTPDQTRVYLMILHLQGMQRMDSIMGSVCPKIRVPSLSVNQA